MATKAKGIFFPGVVEQYLRDEQQTDEVVDYWYGSGESAALVPAAQRVTVPAGGNGGNISLPYVDQILCMDVGLWAGNGPKSEKDHERHREFGVVCGKMAALCSFPGTRPKGEAQFAEAFPKAKLSRDENDYYEERIKPLLDHLSKGGLGDVQVDGAMLAKGSPEDDTTIHVFLGDLHLPVMTEKDATDLGAKGRARVPRAGRLDLSQETKALLRDALEEARSDAPLALKYAWAYGPEFSTPIVARLLGFEVKTFYDAMALLDRQRITSWDGQKTDGTMTHGEAKEWADCYIGSDDCKKKGAEIFQGAAADLVKFLERLEAWKGPRVTLVQTGDLLDFWIGLRRGFDGAVGEGGRIALSQGARAFMEFWGKQTESTHRAGKVLQKLRRLKADPKSCLDVRLLYGNHDNYLSWGQPSCYAPPSGIVFAEHGHQSDGCNSDEDAERGWALTQLAFLWPLVRDWEDPLSAGGTRVGRLFFSADPGSRLQRMARAADVCVKEKKWIYVMGHTHKALLRRINVRWLTLRDALEYRLQCLVERGDLERKAAGFIVEHVEQQLDREGEEAKRLATAFMKLTAEQIEHEVGEARRALESLDSAVGEVVRQRHEEALKRLEQAARALEQARQAAGSQVSKKVEEARQKLAEARQDIEVLAEKSAAQASWMMHQVRRKVEEAGRALAALERTSEVHAREKLDEWRQELGEEVEAARKGLEETRRALVKAEASAEKWSGEKLQSMRQEAAGLGKKLEEARASLRKALGGGGGSGQRGASGSW